MMKQCFLHSRFPPERRMSQRWFWMSDSKQFLIFKIWIYWLLICLMPYFSRIWRKITLRSLWRNLTPWCPTGRPSTRSRPWCVCPSRPTSTTGSSWRPCPCLMDSPRKSTTEISTQGTTSRSGEEIWSTNTTTILQKPGRNDLTERGQVGLLEPRKSQRFSQVGQDVLHPWNKTRAFALRVLRSFWLNLSRSVLTCRELEFPYHLCRKILVGNSLVLQDTLFNSYSQRIVQFK